MLKIYTSKNCFYCDKLKTGLNKLNVKFNEIDVDLDMNKNEVMKIFKMAGEEIVPIITLPPHLLVPKRSFNTIDDALKLISNLIKK